MPEMFEHREEGNVSKLCVVCQQQDSDDVKIVYLVAPDVHICFKDMLWTWTLHRKPLDTWVAINTLLILNNEGES